MNHSEAGKLGRTIANATLEKQKLERVKDYEANPKLCKNCLIPISYEKRYNDFCGHHCAAIFNNKLKGNKIPSKLDNCLFCVKPLTEKGQSKYCSVQCMTDFWWQENRKQLIESGYDGTDRCHIAKKYLIEIGDGKCNICGMSEWQGKPMPLVLDHINGNSEDGTLTNLRVICNNCDAQTDTYKSKNKGNGRASRRKRYLEGKSY